MPLAAPDYQRLFAPGTRHELSRGDVATVRLRQDTTLWLPSGRVIAGEPYGFGAQEDAEAAFLQQVPPGRYPLMLVIAAFAERGHLQEHETIAAAQLLIRDEPVVSWEMAVCEGQDVSGLGEGEFFGYAVDAGTGGFVDAAGFAALCDDEDYFRLLSVSLEVQDADPTAPSTLTDEQGRPLLVAFSSGYGDGNYPTWVGRTAAGEVACFLTDFFVLTDDEDEEIPSAGCAVAREHEMRPGQTLRQQALSSPSGRHTLVHQNDGNLVLYDNGGRGAVWSSGTQGRRNSHCALQTDGDLRIYDEQGHVVWSTDTAGNPGSVLTVGEDGLQLRAPEGTALWSVRTTPGA